MKLIKITLAALLIFGLSLVSMTNAFSLQNAMSETTSAKNGEAVLALSFLASECIVNSIKTELTLVKALNACLKSINSKKLKDPNLIRIHGLWRIGASKCLLPSQIIVKNKEDLDECWTSIHDGGNANYSFWRHEFQEHGDCNNTKELKPNYDDMFKGFLEKVLNVYKKLKLDKIDLKEYVSKNENIATFDYLALLKKIKLDNNSQKIDFNLVYKEIEGKLIVTELRLNLELSSSGDYQLKQSDSRLPSKAKTFFVAFIN